MDGPSAVESQRVQRYDNLNTHLYVMKTCTLTRAKPPESYNQNYWLCLRQRNAWLLQKWLNDGDPFFFFTEQGSPIFISDEDEIEVLFEKNEKYAVRYVEETYWVIWKANGYYFVLNPDLEHSNHESTVFFPPFPKNNAYLKKLRVAVQSALISLSETNEMPSAIICSEINTKNKIGSCHAIYSEFNENGSVGFYTRTKSHSMESAALLKWFCVSNSIKY